MRHVYNTDNTRGNPLLTRCSHNRYAQATFHDRETFTHLVGAAADAIKED